MPTSGKAAASTALPQPPSTSQNVPIASATYFFEFIWCSLLSETERRLAPPSRLLAQRRASWHGRRRRERAPPWAPSLIAATCLTWHSSSTGLGEEDGSQPLRRDHHRRRPQRPRLRQLSRQGRAQGAGSRAPAHLRRGGGHRGDRAGLPRLDLLLRHEHPASTDHRRTRAAPVRARGAAGQRPVLSALQRRPARLLVGREDDPGELRPVLEEGRRGLPGLRRLSAGIAQGRAAPAVPDPGRSDQGGLGASQGDRASWPGNTGRSAPSSTASSTC